MRSIGSLLVLGLVLLTSGCATLFAGGPQTVTFTSNPEGAEVLIDGYPVGRTPCTVQIDRRAFGHRIITMRAPGYATRQFPLNKSINVVAIFNLSSLLFWATDATSGALISYEPNAYYFELRPGGPPMRRGPPIRRGPPRYVDYTEAEKRALYFTLINHHNLRKQIAQRRGSQLDALATLLEIEPENQPTFVAALAKNAGPLINEPYPYRLFNQIRDVGRETRSATRRRDGEIAR